MIHRAMATSLENQVNDAPGPRGLPVVGSGLDLIRDILGTTLKAPSAATATLCVL